MDILYADRELCVCVKPVGVDSEHQLPDLLSQSLGGAFFTVHRLDLNVGGVMVFARTKAAAAALSKAIQEGSMVKEYVALVHGQTEEAGDWSDLLLRDARRNKVFVVTRQRAGVKDARLTYTRLWTDGHTSLVRIRLYTGRSHQIRVQFASRKHPLLGDHKYGARDGLTQPMLHSCCLTFPWKGKTQRFEHLPGWADDARLHRIAGMEAAFDRRTPEDLRILSDYMDSGAWLRDYEADEAGLLPPGFRRGVLSEDGLYNLLADAASARPVIHIFGASGSGTTTLGRYIAERTGMRHMDTDDYYWLPTDPRFTVRRPVEERLTLMRADLDRAARGTVISGSLCGWGDSLISRFTLCIRVATPARVRLERLHAREAARFGARIDAGGDMHQQHLDFLDWAARYDDGPADMRSRTMHDQWQSALPCPVITVDGTQPLADLWAQLQPHIP